VPGKAYEISAASRARGATSSRSETIQRGQFINYQA
jgi:hypothetical protein